MGGRWTVALIAVVCAIGYSAPSHGEVPQHNPAYDDRCPEGQQWSRGPVACKQTNCPPGSTRSYTYDCLCREPVPVGCYENTLTTHCLPAGQKCETSSTGFDPVTGGCKAGYAKNADGACVSTTSGDPGNGHGDDDGDGDGDGDGDDDDDDGDDDGDDDDDDDGDCDEDSCPAGQRCHELDGECVDDPCKDMRESGCCAGDELRFCVEEANWGVGEVAEIGCAGASECGWSADKGRYACVGAGTGAADPSGEHDMVCPGWCSVDPPPVGQNLSGNLAPLFSNAGVSFGMSFQIPEFSQCFNESVSFGVGFKSGGLGKPCTIQKAIDGSAEVCTTAFCTSECTKVTVSGGRDLTFDKVCNAPPEYECDPDEYCMKTSGSLSLEKSYAFKIGTLEFGRSGTLSSKARPGASIAFFRQYAECGLELGIAGSVVASYTTFQGTTCHCKNGGSALTGRGVATFTGSAGCSIRLFGRSWGLPKVSVEGCMNAGIIVDFGGCVPDAQKIGEHIVGGGSVKLKVPSVDFGWFTVNAANVVIDWPAGRSTGCSGVTDL